MKPKKSLGQNFFNNLNLAKKIVEIVYESQPKTVLEIGPGTGYFTRLFYEKGIDITAVEKDSELSNDLYIRYPKSTIINADFLEIDLNELKLVSGETVCFGSLPYNVSKRIIAKLLSSDTPISDFFFIIQKEVAQKYSSKGSSLLGITGKLYADAQSILDISPGSFTPKPKVTSTLIHFHRNNNIQKLKNVETFLKLVRDSFSKPRKMLRNNLSAYEFSDSKLLSKRPHEVTFEEYTALSNSLG